MAEGSVYFEHVRAWKDADDLRKCMEVYEKMGFPGKLLGLGHAWVPTGMAPHAKWRVLTSRS